MKVQLIKDERYPTYYVEEVDLELYPWIQPVDWPVHLDYKIFREVEAEFDRWQDTLASFYREPKSDTTWSTTSSASQILTSSTPTS